MVQKLREILYKIIGLNKLQYKISSELDEMRLILNQVITNQSQLNNIQSEAFDKILQLRLEEKLDYYFRWRFPIQLSDNSSVFMHTNDGHRLYVDNKEAFMTLHLLEHGEWESPFRRELKKYLSESYTFIDIGANIGLHTLLATSLIGINGRVLALEPHPITRELLRKNLEINGLLERVTILPFAASDEDDSLVKFEYFTEHPAMSGLKVSKEILNKFSGTLETIDVKTITVDSLVERYNIVPNLIKIDVEGFEYSVLQGCIKTIENYQNICFLWNMEK